MGDKETQDVQVNSTQAVNDGSKTASVQLKKNQSPSFSKVVSYSMFPKKSQAIVIDTVEGVQIKTYLKAIATKTEPTNIVAASKISQNRFCCYLNDVALVDKLTKEGNNVIEINGHPMKIRPYLVKSKRVIFSNVHPCIPHDVIIDELKCKGINPKSSMSFIRLGIDEVGFTQILSFRRQLFIDPEDINKLPKEITINYDEAIHHIYVSTDKITCFICNLEGHTARYCPTAKQTNTGRQSTDKYLTQHAAGTNNSDEHQIPTQVNISEDQNLGNEAGVTSSPVENVNQLNEFNGQMLFKRPAINDPAPPRTKRHASPSSSSCNTNTELQPSNGSQMTLLKTPKQNKKKKNKTKHITPPNDLELLIKNASVKIQSDLVETFPISFEKLSKFIADSYAIKYAELSALVQLHNIENIDAFIIMLTEVHKNVESGKLKSRITRTINQLSTPSTQQQMDNNISNSSNFESNGEDYESTNEN